MAISVGWKTFTVVRKARRGGGGGMELSFVAAEGGSHSRDSLAPRPAQKSQSEQKRQKFYLTEFRRKCLI